MNYLHFTTFCHFDAPLKPLILRDFSELTSLGSFLNSNRKSRKIKENFFRCRSNIEVNDNSSR